MQQLRGQGGLSLFLSLESLVITSVWVAGTRANARHPRPVVVVDLHRLGGGGGGGDRGHGQDRGKALHRRSKGQVQVRRRAAAGRFYIQSLIAYSFAVEETPTLHHYGMLQKFVKYSEYLNKNSWLT